MVDRLQVERLLQQLYAARVGGRLDELCALFAEDAFFRIAGTSDGKPIAVAARGIGEIRHWLAMMGKTFRLNRREELATVIDGAPSAVHCGADSHFRTTAAAVATALVELIEARPRH